MQQGQELKVVLFDSVLRSVWSRQLDLYDVAQCVFNVKCAMRNVECAKHNLECTMWSVMWRIIMCSTIWNTSWSQRLNIYNVAKCEFNVQCAVCNVEHNAKRNVQPNVQHNMERKLEPAAKSRVCAY